MADICQEMSQPAFWIAKRQRSQGIHQWFIGSLLYAEARGMLPMERQGQLCILNESLWGYCLPLRSFGLWNFWDLWKPNLKFSGALWRPQSLGAAVAKGTEHGKKKDDHWVRWVCVHERPYCNYLPTRALAILGLDVIVKYSLAAYPSHTWTAPHKSISVFPALMRHSEIFMGIPPAWKFLHSWHAHAECRTIYRMGKLPPSYWVPSK